MYFYFSGMFSLFKNLVGGKVLTTDDLQPVLEKLKDHLIGKNVASEIAIKLCQSVETKLEGKVRDISSLQMSLYIQKFHFYLPLLKGFTLSRGEMGMWGDRT